MRPVRLPGRGARRLGAALPRGGRPGPWTVHAVMVAVAMLGTCAAIAPSAAWAQEAVPAATVLEVAQADDRLHTFVAAAHATGLAGVLAGEGPVTVFVPTDQAFHRIADLAALLADVDTLRRVLELHVLPRSVRAAELAAVAPLTTLHGAALDVRVVDGTIYVGEAIVTITDVPASNGALHVVDTVLSLPE